jgi:hypothetical protein
MPRRTPVSPGTTHHLTDRFDLEASGEAVDKGIGNVEKIFADRRKNLS